MCFVGLSAIGHVGLVDEYRPIRTIHPDTIPMGIIAYILNQACSQGIGRDIARYLRHILVLPDGAVVIMTLPKASMLIQVAVDGEC